MGTDQDDLIKIEEGQEPSGDSDDGHGLDHREPPPAASAASPWYKFVKRFRMEK